MQKKETPAWFAGWLTSTCEIAAQNMETALALIDGGDPEAARAILVGAIRQARKSVVDGQAQTAI